MTREGQGARADKDRQRWGWFKVGEKVMVSKGEGVEVDEGRRGWDRERASVWARTHLVSLLPKHIRFEPVSQKEKR